MKSKICLLLVLLCGIKLANAQTFTRADTLRGMLTPLRTCYDVTYYHLDVKVDPDKKVISGTNTIQFRAVTPFDRMQVDLDSRMNIEQITSGDEVINFERESGAVYLDLPETVEKGSIQSVKVSYAGPPLEAQRPPWDGGLVWARDEDGNPWVAVTVQGDGAFLWWPNKEHQSDEPDSMLLSVTIPDTLMNISNGRLRKKLDLGNGWSRWDWFMSYPINNYNVTLNIGKYAHFADVYVNEDGDSLTLDYYVMPYNLQRAKKQFEQVKPMMACLEKLFGNYPFYNDGFKLVESPHLGMEHQSAVAYGNKYRNGYLGRASSEEGLWFDFIIIHETAHEWWGNSVTSKDIADMWIHEGFGAYTESIYVECLWGYEAGQRYQNGKKFGVRNDRPIIGFPDVNHQGSGDMYNKGSLFLNTLRSVINNDDLWFEIIKGIPETFKYQTITTEDIIKFVNEKTGGDYRYMFDQYLRHASIPTLEVTLTKTGDKVAARYRWVADVEGFRMPIKVTTSKDSFEFIEPTAEWQTMPLNLQPQEFRVAENEFYVNTRIRLNYQQDPEEYN